MAAADFYFAINATFRFIRDHYGEEALIRYWRALGRDYYAPVTARFRDGGLDEVERYWRDFFEAEPEGRVAVARREQRVEIDVQVCPAIHWLRIHEREIMPDYCRHCLHVSTAMAEGAGLTFSVEGGGGMCRQQFHAGKGTIPS